MKLPSITVLWQNFKNVTHRFPLQIGIAIIATGIWCYLAEPNIHTAYTNNLVKLLLVCNLGLTLLLALDTYAESKSVSSKFKWLNRLIAIVFLVGLYFLLDPYKYVIDAFRFGLLAFSFHLLVAFSPFINSGNLNGFWQYNKTLFLRFLISAFYAAVLYAGLAIALFAIDGLFNVEIRSNAYMKLFALVSAGFTSIFFLAGVPSDFETLQKEDSYPKGLKIFTQYVLIPLMTIYLLILLVYEAKIAINWELPKGLVSTLILGYAVFGILSLLLIYPIKEKEGNGWMKLFSKFFYLMMIPLIILLILAVVKRVGNYGITESRYILIILAAWLIGITVYFLFSKKQNIKTIPISLFILSVLAVYGPQSAFSVSEASQVSRLKRLMNGKSKKGKSEISEVVRYLVERHGLTSLQKFTEINLSEIEDKIYAKANASKSKVYDYEIKADKVDTAFALLKIKEFKDFERQKHFEFTNEEGNLINVNGYDGVLSVESYFSATSATFENKKIEVSNTRLRDHDNYAEKLTVKFDGKELVFDINHLGKSLVKENNKEQPSGKGLNLPTKLMRITQQSSGYTFTFVATRLYGYYNSDGINDLNFNGYLLIKKN